MLSKGENQPSVLAEATALKESLVDKLISLKTSQGTGRGETTLQATTVTAAPAAQHPGQCFNESPMLA